MKCVIHHCSTAYDSHELGIEFELHDRPPARDAADQPSTSAMGGSQKMPAAGEPRKRSMPAVEFDGEQPTVKKAKN